jgi:hypothetical protein
MGKQQIDIAIDGLNKIIKDIDDGKNINYVKLSKILCKTLVLCCESLKAFNSAKPNDSPIDMPDVLKDIFNMK